MTTETKICQNCKNRFAIEPESSVIYEKMGIPAPDECHVCIWKQLMSFWVFGKFHKTKSALSGKTIITTFSEGVKFPLYSYDEWVSDAWDPMQYGEEYDFSKPFFEQFGKLQAKVPHPHQSGTHNTNCDWSDDVWSSKNCYLCRSILDCEETNYCYRTFGCKNSVDLVFSFDTELSYDSAYLFKCYNVKYAFDARNSMDSAFLYDCRNVQHCFMCWNLRSKQYHILNQPYSKEEYLKKLKEFDTRSYATVQKLKMELERLVAQEAIHRENYNVNAVNAAGNFLEECRNCAECYFLQKSENSRYVFRGLENKDVIHAAGSIIEKGAFSVMDGYVYEVIVASHCSHCRYSAYLDYCEECEYCFGCAGLRKKKFCILNKQYSEDEYKTLLPKIKEHMQKTGEWGKFFPPSLAYGGYNLSTAQFYFPETKEAIEKRGGIWEEITDATVEGIRGEEVPDRAEWVNEDFCKQPIVCPKTGWRFNVAPQELAFYKAQGIPLPHNHFDYRMRERFRPLTAATPYSGACHFCSKKITHFYPPEWGYKKIACTECYHRKVY